jgi:hypothetical protein
MWTRHASRVTAEKRRFGVVIHVSETFSAIVRPGLGRTRSDHLMATPQLYFTIRDEQIA